MPTFTHGRNAKVLANGYDLSAFFKSVSQTGTSDTAEVSTLGSTSKNYIPGLKDSKFSVDGFYDATAAGSDVVLSGIIGAATVWTTVFSSDAVGARGYVATVIGTSVATGADIGGAVSVKAEGQATTGPDAITVLSPLAARTATANGTQVDNTTATTNGASSYLQVTAAAGSTPTLVVKLQHSVDASTWVDLATHTTVVAGNQSERIAVTGTVNRYIRTLYTITGSSPTFTFHHAAARL